MKMSLTLVIAGSIVSATLMLCASPAMAHGPRVNWSVNVGSPYYAPPIYYSPPPQVVYVQPEPVYIERAVVGYPGPYYAYQERQWREHQWREYHGRHGHRGHHHDGEDDD